MRFLGTTVGRYLILAIVLGVLWLCLSGEDHWGNPVLSAFGVASIFLAIGLTERAGLLDGESVPTRVFPGILGYVFWLTFEIGKANVAVVRHVLSPNMNISPKIVTVPTNQKTDLARAIFANSITLTPGTVSVDLYDDNILVHALTEELADIDGITSMGQKVRALDGSDEEGASDDDAQVRS